MTATTRKTPSRALGCFNAATLGTVLDARGRVLGQVWYVPNAVAWVFGTVPEAVRVTSAFFGEEYTRDSRNLGAERIAAKGWLGDAPIPQWIPEPGDVPTVSTRKSTKTRGSKKRAAP